MIAAKVRALIIADARFVVHRAWSFRFTILAAVLPAVEFALPIFADDPPVPRGTFAALAFVVSIAAAGARFIAQRRDTNDQSS
jgi:hypothetical protein